MQIQEQRLAHGTGEWAKHNVNIQTGCEHDCRYCYAKCMAIRFKRSTPTSWASPRMEASKISRAYRKRDGRFMFPTTHDITPRNIDFALGTLRQLVSAGNSVLIVNKPHLSCIKTLCDDLTDYKNQILFRFTIGSASDKTLAFWEPGAPRFSERLRALRWAYDRGFGTSVSCEPMLDQQVDKVIDAVRPFVTDSIWIGRANRLKGILALNCPHDISAMAAADNLLFDQSDDWIRQLYERYRNDSMIKWKDSIKKVIGLDRPSEKGLDI